MKTALAIPASADFFDGRSVLRLFFALWPSAESASQISEWAHDAHALCGGRIMRPETMHLTLAFLGDTPVDGARQLAQAAAGWVIPTGTLVLRRFGRFSGPRVVWAGPLDHDDAVLTWLADAYNTLWHHLEQRGWQRPASAFRPHVSLLRKAGSGEVEALQKAPLAWTPQQCVLVASAPSEQGSAYQVLARLPWR
ncbi:RNA 2',3'-cyclic phosphodiesterase [Alcaligenaceae bacterium]|nr:RNA 2',3'-cyclic phosphodiesterase [Alcaligenaceae bacterium]